MKIERIARRTYLSLLLSLASAGTASAQCLEFAPGFGPQGGGLSDGPRTQVVFDDGSGPALYVGGLISLAGNLPVNNVAKWDGSSWSPLGDGLNGEVWSLAVFDDGTGPALFAGGTFLSGALNFIARWDGSAWSGVGGGLQSPVLALTVFDDGSGPRLYAGGSFPLNGQSAHIARWDGSSWSAVGTGLPHTVLALQGHDDGSGSKLYAASQWGVQRWDGSTWSGYLGGTQLGSAECMAVFDDGSGPELYVGGNVDVQPGAPYDSIMKWDGQGWSAVGNGIWYTTGGGGLNALTVYDDGSGSKLYAGGRFTSAGGAPASHLAAWDGTSWSPISGWTQPGGVTSLGVFDDGSGPRLHVGGDILVAGPVISRGIASWDGTDWHPMLDGPYEGVTGTLYSLAAFDDGHGEALYAAGSSLTVAGTTPVQGIARWNGTNWTAVGGGIGGTTYTMKVYDDGTGPALFVAGEFNTAGAVSAINVAKWDGQDWSAVGAPGDVVEVLAVYDHGTGAKLYAGGRFSGGIQVWNGTSWIPHPAGPLDAKVSSMTVHDDGTGPALYVAGMFTHANGTIATQRIAKWKGGAWIPLGCGLGVGDSTNNENVYALESFDFGSGPELVAGGTFSVAGCAPSSNVVRWNGSSWSSLPGLWAVRCFLDFDDGDGPELYAGNAYSGGLLKLSGSSWVQLDGGLESTAGVFALASFENVPSGGPDLFAGGGILSAGGSASIGIAEWRGCAGPGTEFCFGDGSEGACPCSNQGLPGHGCENSSSTGGATLSASGRRHPDTVVLTAAGERPTAFSIFLQGRAVIGPLNYGDGLRCAGGALKRLYNKNAVGGQVSAPQGGDLSITARSAQAGDPIALGSTRYYQTYYRDPSLTYCPAPTGNTLNVTNGVRIEW